MPKTIDKKYQYNSVATKSETGGNIALDFIPGMPPDMILPGSNAIMRNSMPVVDITPGKPYFKGGLDLFSRTDEWNTPTTGYHTLLKSHGFYIPNRTSLQLAFLADSFPTDSFTNEYGESFLQGMTSVASEGAQAIMQISGGRTATEAITGLTNALLPKAAAGVASDLVGKMKSGLSAIGLKNAANLADKVLAGARIDFPMVWKTSGFVPSYTMTIRLYNPNPRSDEMTLKYIIGPIAAIMLLGIPISDDGSTYTWPYIHKIYSPGIYDLDPAFISNVTVIKGGDQQQIAWNQRMAMVDVRIDFGSLYSSMLASNTESSRTRPTLRKYLNGMKTSKAVTDRQGIQVLDHPDFKLAETKKIPATKVEKTSEQKQNPSSRVASSLTSKYNDLLDRVPDSIKDIFD
jgi:hypothetical protein